MKRAMNHATMTHAEMKDGICQVLQEARGEHLSAYTINMRLGVREIGTSATKLTCAELINDGRIRRGGARSGATFYVPTSAQLAVENADRAKVFKPLLPRKQHAALLQRLAAERNQIKSIG